MRLDAGVVCAVMLASALAVAGCRSSHLEPPEVQGSPAMVDDGGKMRLWGLIKQEEVRQVGVGGGATRKTSSWRSDTFFHFEIRAFDPLTARPLWKQRLLTLGDADASGSGPSRVIGSSVDARLLGQDGDSVWLLVGNAPMAVSASDGRVLADVDRIGEANPGLRELLPADAGQYGFDRGLVLLAADARRLVIRGASLQAVDYVPTPVAASETDLMANGRERIVPMRPPLGEVPTRLVTLGNRHLGLYTAREAADAANDAFGNRLRYPYTVLDEGAQARRSFWNADVVQEQRFDERYPRLAALRPIAGAPVFLKGRFLKGRFLKNPGTDDAMRMTAPAGWLVWHSTRIDSAGRLALTRLDDTLQVVWKAELPLSETGTVNPVAHWLLPGRLAVAGRQELVDDGTTRREMHLVTVDLANGRWQGWSIPREQALP